ncbi:hypothetical protein GCM10017567_73970 [Amycolatopsis bullii]|uniref:Uncharacterized protein n=1 Tax=Amycolatopsis bullii TaxID=941987 RepID=A0ABQ3KNM8_9PSEU|nr:hypothetical protein GCM10017567_73970 [Amycolatopsis bullii]
MFAAEAAGAGSTTERMTAARNTADFAVRPVRYAVIRSPLIDDVTMRERYAMNANNRLHRVGVNDWNRTGGKFSRLFDNFP